MTTAWWSSRTPISVRSGAGGGARSGCPGWNRALVSSRTPSPLAFTMVVPGWRLAPPDGGRARRGRSSRCGSARWPGTTAGLPSGRPRVLVLAVGRPDRRRGCRRERVPPFGQAGGAGASRSSPCDDRRLGEPEADERHQHPGRSRRGRPGRSPAERPGMRRIRRGPHGRAAARSPRPGRTPLPSTTAAAAGAMTGATPTNVATLRPPRPRVHTGNACPSIAAPPVTIGAHHSSTTTDPRRAATVPLAMSPHRIGRAGPPSEQLHRIPEAGIAVAGAPQIDPVSARHEGPRWGRCRSGTPRRRRRSP